MLKRFLGAGVALAFAGMLVGISLAQDVLIFGDARPDAPELAARGNFDVGVRTLSFVNPNQIDILKVTAENPEPRYDRPLTVEVWYPAALGGETPVIVYEDTLGRADDPNQPLVPFTFGGRAARDADADMSAAPYPLIVISHGFPGSRFLMTYLAENLASKGYVVASIDHTESVFSDVSGFASTLLNRPLDVRFVIDQMAAQAEDADSPFRGLLDANNTGLIGYSMGGYGVLNVAGGRYGSAYLPVLRNFGLPGVEFLAVNSVANPDFTADERVKAVYALAPWGMNFNLWDADSLSTLDVPVFFVAGDQDDISGFVNGPRRLFELATNSERYLLVFEGARHNVAPNPPPAAAVEYDQFMRYADSVWDSTRMNNINQHFATAFFDLYLKGADTAAYLNLIEVAVEGRYSVAEDGSFNPDHTYWLGFPNRSAVGLRLERRAAGE
jgi:predicted dienelactone hydrolase